MAGSLRTWHALYSSKSQPGIHLRSGNGSRPVLPVYPPLDWMKQSLLFFDATSSIVPTGYRDTGDIAGLATSSYINAHADTLRWLEDEGHWIPVTSKGVWDLPECTYDLFRAIAALVKAKDEDNLTTVSKDY